jgi:hypothetical protein
MPRPLRIEYENAFYHVMNRGRGSDIRHTFEKMCYYPLISQFAVII